MNDRALEMAVAKILDAIDNPGVRPDIHHETLRRHRAEWPTLWAALDELRAARAQRC